jgi:tetratricopeptide (TPR) repeat protein
MQLKLAAAARSADALLAAAPNLADAHYLRGVVDMWTGEFGAAVSRFETALQLGSADAEKKLLLLRWSDAIGKTTAQTVRVGEKEYAIDPGVAENHVKLADLFVENNLHGRALATLEAADVRLPGQPLILKSLVARYLDFGMAEEAMSALVRWEQVAGVGNEDVNASRVLVERLLLVPKFAKANRKAE